MYRRRWPSQPLRASNMKFIIVGSVFALELISTLLTVIDYQGIAVIIGAIGSAIAAVYAARAHAAAVDANKTAMGIASVTGELEKQGNSRWDEIKKELQAAREEIKGLQQLRVDDAVNKH